MSERNPVFIMLVVFLIIGCCSIALRKNIARTILFMQGKFLGKRDQLLEKKFGLRFVPKTPLAIEIMCVFVGVIALVCAFVLFGMMTSK